MEVVLGESQRMNLPHRMEKVADCTMTLHCASIQIPRINGPIPLVDDLFPGNGTHPLRTAPERMLTLASRCVLALLQDLPYRKWYAPLLATALQNHHGSQHASSLLKNLPFVLSWAKHTNRIFQQTVGRAWQKAPCRVIQCRCRCC